MEYALLGTLYAIALWDTCQCVLLFGSTIIVVNKMLYALGFCCAVRLLGQAFFFNDCAAWTATRIAGKLSFEEILG